MQATGDPKSCCSPRLCAQESQPGSPWLSLVGGAGSEARGGADRASGGEGNECGQWLGTRVRCVLSVADKASECSQVEGLRSHLDGTQSTRAAAALSLAPAITVGPRHGHPAPSPAPPAPRRSALSLRLLPLTALTWVTGQRWGMRGGRAPLESARQARTALAHLVPWTPVPHSQLHPFHASEVAPLVSAAVRRHTGLFAAP